MVNQKKIRFKIKLFGDKIFISSDDKIFGPQPFLAIKTKNKKYYHENFYIKKPFKEWIYTFDRHSVKKNNVDIFAFAANDKFGNTCITKVRFNKKKPKIKISYL